MGQHTGAEVHMEKQNSDFNDKNVFKWLQSRKEDCDNDNEKRLPLSFGSEWLLSELGVQALC